MSKKTNAEKRNRKRTHYRVPRGVRGKRMNRVAFSPASLQAITDGVVDFALGNAFVQLLKGLGVRDKVVEIIFCPGDHMPADENHEGAD